jgi:hypothetical protein
MARVRTANLISSLGLMLAVVMFYGFLTLHTQPFDTEQPSYVDPRYGTFTLEPFDGSWLNDLPHLVDHLRSEHLLHIRGHDENGVGYHWTANKYAWKLNPQFNPQAKATKEAPRGGFQMRIGYFEIPINHIQALKAAMLDQEILRDLEIRDANGNLTGYRFFVHPEGYRHFAALHEAKIPFVKPSESSFMGTPTSSYRSWVIRRISPDTKTTPFIFKMGVATNPQDTRRLLPTEDVIKSLHFQNIFERIATHADFLYFPETLGMILRDIPDYPSKAFVPNGKLVDSGAIIRQFPAEFLEGRCKIFSFSAVMSAERTKVENHGVAALLPPERGLGNLPLIYELFESAIQNGQVKNSVEFMQGCLIDGYLNAIEPIALKEGLALSPHGQNLCVVWTPNQPLRFAYRDLEGIYDRLAEGFLESYTMYYYDNFIKTLNVLVKTEEEYRDPPPGAPTQKGFDSIPRERNLYPYLWKVTEFNSQARAALETYGITEEQYDGLIRELNEKYITRLNKYFNVPAADVVRPDGTLPAAEKNSAGSAEVAKHNRHLWMHRRIQPQESHFSINPIKDRE